MLCNNCGKTVEFNKYHTAIVCHNKECECFEEEIYIQDYIEEIKMNAYNTIEWYKAAVKLWENKYKILFESKIKAVK